ncbi:MAG: hypothetical protein ABIJ09_12260 [Pseudomonadota bacterium]
MPVEAAAAIAATTSAADSEEDLLASLDLAELAADAATTPAPPPEPVTTAKPAAPAGSTADTTSESSAPARAKIEIGEDPLAGKAVREPLPAGFISDAQKKHVDPATPPKARMLAARAMVPMSPRDQVHVLYQLTYDEHPKVAAAAEETLAKLPERILDGVVGDNRVAPQVLAALAEAVLPNQPLSEKLLINPSTPDAVYVIFAERTGFEAVVEIVANNQQRLLRNQDIVRALKRNEATLKSTLERVVDFMVRNGVLLRDMFEFSESFSRLNQKELEEAIAEVEVPFELLSPEEQQRLKLLGRGPTHAPQIDLAELERLAAMDDGMSLEDMDLLAQAEDSESGDGDENKKKSALELLRTMTVAQQVKLAMVGNKEVRSLLLRSTVRMVAEAAIRSPKITEMEVIAASTSRSVQDSVIRLIASNREWTRMYQVKISLCNNPKTPLSFTMSFLRGLRLHDLKSIAKSKNIPSALTEQAKRLLNQKGGAG